MSSGVPLRLRFSEVAQILGLRQKQVSDLVSRGELPVALVGEQARIPAQRIASVHRGAQRRGRSFGRDGSN